MQTDPERTNRLGGEVSAYLRQHMHNPVDWYPWGEEALSRARDEDRPLLISIGYSACHWCHVMERESFEDAETAALMNEGFINIKVDREERPDVDQIYMDAVMRLNGHGGWPLTIFCTPDGRPFYGGTYFPPEPRQGLPSFRQLLNALRDAYRDRRGEVEQSAAHILAALSQRAASGAGQPPGLEPLLEGARELLREADREHGGFGNAPKFPTPVNLDALLLAADFLPEEEAARALRAVAFSCREMARRGLYDHLGGGFHRYCVDARWEIPHFEKMLYDQGLLLASYAEAWRRTRDEALLWPLRETAAYLQRELRAPDGGFFASQDADSEGEEGLYYVWRPEEIAALLGPRAQAFCEAYSVTKEGNFEGGRTHLVDRARRPRADFADDRRALHTARTARVPPATDPKRVAAWNGYTISGLARAGSLLDDGAMLDAAIDAADFVLGRMIDPEGRLLRVFDGGRANVGAFLDDHAALQAALLDIHRAGAGDRFLVAALRISDQIAERFYDAREEDLFLTPADAEPLIHRPRSDHDGATPHAAGLAVLGLLRAAELCARGDLREIALRVLRSHAGVLQRAPRAFPTLSRAAAIAARGLTTLVVAGDRKRTDTRALALCARRALRPEDAVLLHAPGEAPPAPLDPSWFEGRVPVDGAPAAYLCQNGACSLPVTDPGALTAAIAVR